MYIKKQTNNQLVFKTLNFIVLFTKPTTKIIKVVFGLETFVSTPPNTGRSCVTYLSVNRALYADTSIDVSGKRKILI